MAGPSAFSGRTLDCPRGPSSPPKRQAIAVIAHEAGETSEALIEATLDELQREIRAKRYQARRLAEELDRFRRARLLPSTDALEKVARYEAHLERSLYRALHELQRLQARRSGEPTPLPVAIDVTGDADRDGR